MRRQAMKGMVAVADAKTKARMAAPRMMKRLIEAADAGDMRAAESVLDRAGVSRQAALVVSADANDDRPLAAMADAELLALCAADGLTVPDQGAGQESGE